MGEAVALAEPEWLTVESLDLEGQGVAHTTAGKVVFIEGALPGEQVQVRVRRSKNSWEQGTLGALRNESAQRVVPRCPHFGVCGGCKVQHFHVGAQMAVKQRVVEETLWHLGKTRPEQILRPIEGPAWRYRFRARFSVHFVKHRGAMLIGFHEEKSSHVADIKTCDVVPAHVSAMLLPLRALVFGMKLRERVPQIELAVGDGVTALVLRHLDPIEESDLQRLRDFALVHGVQWWLQPKGPETAALLDDTDARQLRYSLPEYGIVMPFRPTDFIQVNPQVNQVLVKRAMRLLDPQASERDIDWFCGLGNFTLPIARSAASVLGIEGSASLVERAKANAAFNGLADKTSYDVRNLFELTPEILVDQGRAEKWLVDPPRDGAFALCKALVDLVKADAAETVFEAPRRIVYVSCNPATLARDAGLLVHEAGYRCTAAGAINMFPQTGHVESIAVFERC
ncbi:MAG: rumA [Rhizobacter sp.]|nr:rumA [Rhizobacter sp.]